MKKIFFSIFIALSLSAQAQTQLESPLRFVPADSIVGMGFDRTDLRRTAILGGNGENVPTISATHLRPKAFAKALQHWQHELLPQFSLSGIGGRDIAGTALTTASETLDAAARLLLLTADASFADAIERLTYNQLLSTAAQSEEGSFEKSYALRAVARAAGMAFATDDEGVFINLYMNGSAIVHAGRVRLTLDIITKMPEEGRVKVRIGGLKNEGTPFKMRVRIPLWAEGKIFPEGSFEFLGRDLPELKIYVNGRPPLSPQRRSGYVEIDREWNNGDELMLYLPVQSSFVRLAAKGKDGGTRGELAAICGPLLYAPTSKTDSCYAVASLPPEIAPEANRQGHIQLLVKMFSDKNIPADKRAPEVQFLLQPFMDCPPSTLPWLREPK